MEKERPSKTAELRALKERVSALEKEFENMKTQFRALRRATKTTEESWKEYLDEAIDREDTADDGFVSGKWSG
jgi:chromosome segregation ATPase